MKPLQQLEKNLTLALGADETKALISKLTAATADPKKAKIKLNMLIKFL
jgi:hypothetical protein